MKMVNTEVGELAQTQNGMFPGIFRTNFEPNYTFTFQAQNYEKNMIITLKLPKEIDFGDEVPYCTGLQGTSNEVLICAEDRKAKTITFSNVMQFADANPGQVVILIENLKNPAENSVTSSF